MKSLTSKLVKVMAEVKYVQKSGYNAFHKYNYATEADVLDKVRESLTKYNVFIFQSVENVTKEGELTTASVKYTLVDGDTGESMSVMSAGSGADKSDKGVYKAITGASKYFLLKNFMVATGDDPEASDVDGKATGHKVINATTINGTVTSSTQSPAGTTPTATTEDTPKKKPSFSRKTFAKAPPAVAATDDSEL